MKRREARELLFTLLYEASFCCNDEKDEMYDNAVANRGLDSDEYVRSSYFAVHRHLDELDDIISKFARGWSLGRISRVTMSILRLSVYEMLYADDIPCIVSINEAVDLAKKYGDEKAAKFINGILNNIADSMNLKEACNESVLDCQNTSSDSIVGGE